MYILLALEQINGALNIYKNNKLRKKKVKKETKEYKLIKEHPLFLC